MISVVMVTVYWIFSIIIKEIPFGEIAEAVKGLPFSKGK